MMIGEIAMFDRLGHVTYRRRRWVLALAGAFLVFGGVWGTGVFGALISSGFDTPGSESATALARVEDTVGRDAADIVVLYRDGGRTVEDPQFRDAVQAHLADLPSHLVAGTATYWSAAAGPAGQEQAQALVSQDRTRTYAVIHLAGADEDALMAAYDALEPRLRQAPGGLSVQLGGNEAIASDITTQVGEDIARAEALSMPIVLVLLVVVFGGLTAASLPLAIGGLAILGSFTMLRLLTLGTDVSVFSINIVTMLGLGLAIDYALFVVSRFREELGRGATTEDALVRTMATAGRTVAFSGLTVAISLASLLLFPQVFLRSMGFGGMAAVLVAMVGALTVLPALLAVLGHRVNSLRVPLPRRTTSRRAQSSTDGQGAWSRLAHSVMRRPVVYVAVIVPVLLLAGAPFLRVEFGGVDHRALPAGTESRVVSETLLSDFPSGGTTTIDPVVTFADGTVDSATNQAALDSYVDRVGALPGVTGVQVGAEQDGTALLSVHHDYEGISSEARDLVGEIRAVPAPHGAEVLVGGRAAELRDLLSSLGGTLPWMGLFVLGVTFALLFLAFGSVVLPLKAVVMNVLSLSASFGALVWIFQDGHLAGLLGFTSTGFVEATQPILMLAMAFGLSMDYEVFLLSRVHEQWDRTGDNTAAVAGGLQRTGKIITSAALLLVVVIGAFATSGIVFIKMIGVGMIIAILVDATIVRALLVPATMRLLGRRNWWAPRPLARFWARWGLREDADGPAAVTSPRSPDRQEAVSSL
ncbi:MAG: trehalose monomycolate/heme transporter [Actinomycetota bacterium]|nr:trehalose monomycolate/heme transporter [Actinomycetota bacterium]